MGVKAATLAQEIIKKSQNRCISWRTLAADGDESFIAMVQIYSDKSQTSLKTSALKFYPLHLTLFNFKEEWRRRVISSGESIIGYLPVEFSELTPNGRRKGNREDILLALHDSIEFIFEPLMKVAMEGISFQTADFKNVRAHLMLSSYVADIPEAEDMLSIKRNTNTSSPCHRCLVGKESMSCVTDVAERSVGNNLKMFHSLKSGDEEVTNNFKKLSMIPVPPVLNSFPFVGIHPSVDIYAIFGFEPMHNLSLGISKLLKECTVSYLKDDKRVRTSIETLSGEGRNVSLIRKSILSLLNCFLREVQYSSPGYGIHVDFSKGLTAGRLSGLFTKDGIVGMLEAADHECIDIPLFRCPC